MSVKKSWDVEPSPRRASVPVRSAAPRADTRRKVIAPKPRKEERVVARARTREPLSKEPLKVRRARARRLFIVGVSVLSACILGALIYAAWLPALRVSEVFVEGPSAERIKQLALKELQGTHLFIVPKNSLFFIPESSIRARMLQEHPEVVAVSFKAHGLQGLTVIALERSSAFLWCGDSYETKLPTCYRADADGMVFAPHESLEPLASSTLLLRVYVPLEGGAAEPIRAHVGYSSALPHALRFAKALRELGASIAELAIRNDEADFYTKQGTRITYVIGREKEAAQLAASAFPKLTLSDSSVEYVDLRFEGKVYLRKVGE